MIRVVYFAKTRETIGKAEETLQLPSGIATVESVLNLLIERGEPYQRAFEDGRILAAINQEMVSLQSRVEEGDELAFFPPVTGG